MAEEGKKEEVKKPSQKEVLEIRSSLEKYQWKHLLQQVQLTED